MLFRWTALALLVSAFPGLARAQLDIAVTANPDPAARGEIVEVVIEVSNTSALSQANLTIEFDTPAGLNSFSEAIISDAGDCLGGSNAGSCEAGEILRWTLGALAPGQGARVSLAAVVAATTPIGTVIPFAARILQSAVTVDLASASATVAAANTLDLTLGSDANPAAAGEEIEYTLSFGNPGAVALGELTLRLPLPAGTSFVSASEGGALDGADIEWTISSLPAGSGTTRRARVAVGGAAANGALLPTVASLVPSAAPADEARAGLVTRVESGSPLVLGLVANPDPAKPGEMVEIELTAANRGALALSGVTIELRIPAGVASAVEVNITGSGDCLGGSNPGSCEPAELIRWTPGAIPAGEGVSVVLPHFLGAAVSSGSVIPFRARAKSGGADLAETAASVLVQSAPRFDLALWVDRDPVVVGDVLTYSVAYGNESLVTSPDTALELQLPPGAVLLSASEGGTQVGGSVTWALGSLPSRAGDQRRVRVQLPAGSAAGALVKSVAARVRDTTVVLNEARATALARTAGAAPLIARAAVNQDPARPTAATTLDAEMSLLELVVANTGNVPIAGVSIDLRIPFELFALQEINFEGGGNCLSATNGGFCEPGEYAVYALGTLQPGEARAVSYPLFVQNLDTLGGTLLTANADVRAAGFQAASASTALVIDDAPALDLVLDAGSDPSVPGGSLDLLLSFGNEGLTSRELQLELPVPAGASLLSASNGGQLRNGAVRWNAIQTPAQQGGTRRVRLQLPAGTGLLDLLPARIFDVASPSDVARAADVVQLEAAPPLGLSATAQPTSAGRGGALDVDFVASNSGAVPLLGVNAAVQTPDQINALTEGATFTGDCQSGSQGGFCTVGELALWSLGELGSLATSGFSLPPVITTTAVIGGHIRTRGRVLDANGNDAIASVSVRVGSILDTDADGVQQLDDNCPVFANLDQTDTDLDGRGNACECGDQTLDGRNTVSDLVAINVAIFNPGQVTPLCDANNDGLCNVNDIIAANVEIFSPTNTSTCARQPVPGP